MHEQAIHAGAQSSAALPEEEDTQQSVSSAIDGLSFLARYFGRNIDAKQLMVGLPAIEGRPSLMTLQECAARAGLALVPMKVGKESVRSSMLPALAIAPHGGSLIILDRKGSRLECADPRTGTLSWIEMSALPAENDDQWYSVRPVFFFDSRSLLYYVREPQRWFWDTLKSNRSIYGWAIVATVFVNVVGAVIPFYAMAVYDRVVPNSAMDSLWVLTSAAVFMLFFDLATKMLRSYLLDAAGRRADLALSAQVFAQALRMRAASRPASGGVWANSVRDFESVREFFTSSTLVVLGDLPFMLFYLALIALVGGVLVFVPIGLIPIALGIALYMRRPLRRVIFDVQLLSDRNCLGRQEQNLKIVPGMTVEARITTGERSVLEYMLKPIAKVVTGALQER